MLLSVTRKGLFCVASPNFEKSKSITVVKVIFNSVFIRLLMKTDLSLWENVLVHSYYVTTDCISRYHNNHYTREFNHNELFYFIKLDCILIKTHTRRIAWSARHTKWLFRTACGLWSKKFEFANSSYCPLLRVFAIRLSFENILFGQLLWCRYTWWSY